MNDSIPDERAQRRKTREQEKIRARKAQRVTYDLPPELRQRVKALAEEQRLPASQLVTLALLRLLADHQAGRLVLSRYKRPSRSPRYDWNLEYPQDLLLGLKKRK
jgi:hypothetical protein